MEEDRDSFMEGYDSAIAGGILAEVIMMAVVKLAGVWQCWVTCGDVGRCVAMLADVWPCQMMCHYVR